MTVTTLVRPLDHNEATERLMTRPEPRGRQVATVKKSLRRILVAPSGFKESLSAEEVAEAISIGIRRVLPDAQIDAVPVPDGGEGTARTLAAATNGRLVPVQVTGPVGEKIESHYATAMAPFLAVAAVAGVERLTRVADLHRPALRRLPAALLLLSAGSAFALRGASPLAPDFTFAAYRDDDDSRAARALVARANSDPAAPRVVAEARVLAHLAERPEPILDPAQRYYWKARTGGR